MKEFKRSNLPDSISYNKKTYILDVQLSGKYDNKLPFDEHNCIIVTVFDRRLKNKVDLRGQPYKPQGFIFKTEDRYKVFKVFRNSARRQTIAKNVSLAEATNIVNSFADNDKYMACRERI